MVEGLPVIKETTGICKGCVIGKHPEHKFDWGKANRATSIFGLIHSDISGPMPITSMNGSRYLLTFIDDFSRYTWVFFLKKKSEVCEKFSELKALIENASGLKIKILRSDNGGEYVSNELLSICSQSGIQVQHSIPYTPQQNGVAERKNRSLKEMTTCMLESKKLAANLWAEAMHAAAYIQNRVPHSSVKGKTPFEAYFGHKPDVSNLRVFGSTAWARIPLDKRRALQP